MIYMVITSYPLKSTIETGKVFVKSAANPIPHVNNIGMWIAYGGDGITNYWVAELEKGHEDEAVKAIVGYFVQYYDIEGFKIDMFPVAKPEDALPILGMTPPT